MKIDELKINSYGKFKNLELKFKNHINIVFGKNEAGKSTLINYILSSFYGISKKKNGKEYSDYDRYLPWSGEDFSGRLSYSLNDGRKYEVYRDFKKKNPKIFNEKKEDISNSFNIDKSLGNQFFYEQTKIDEGLFLSTFVSNQQEVKLQRAEQGMLVQKIANLVGTGEDNTSFKLAMNRINKRQLDEVGTDRSREKPINLLNKRISQLEDEKSGLDKYEEFKYEIEEKILDCKEKIGELDKELKKYSEFKINLENEKIEREKLKLQEELKVKNFQKIKDIEDKIENIKNENEGLFGRVENHKVVEKGEKNKVIGWSLLIIFINIIQFIFLKGKVINYSIFAISSLVVLSFCIKYFKVENRRKKEEIKRQEDLKKIEVIKEKIQLLDSEIDMLLNSNKEVDKLIEKMEREIIKSSVTNLSLQDVQIMVQKVQEELNNFKIELHSLELDKNNIEPNIERIAKIEEEYAICLDKKKELEKLNESMELAKEVLSESYEIMKNSVTPRFTENLSRNISEITNRKYSNVRFNDEIGLIVENEFGEYVPATKLSVGTIEELYLSLRLSMIDDLSDENMPVFLDESFAYFDDDRLENFLKYIDKKYVDKQFVIFTCTNREKDILDGLDIKYNYINLS